MIFKIIAIILMGIFYICYFAKMFSQKKKGINTDQLGKGKKGFVKCVEIALKVTTYILPLLQIVSILLSSKSDNTVLSIVGVAVEMLGVIVFILSVTEMKDNWRAGVQREEKTSLVTSGIYSMSRNPAFLGFELMYIGILVVFFNWYLLIATIITIGRVSAKTFARFFHDFNFLETGSKNIAKKTMVPTLATSEG